MRLTRKSRQLILLFPLAVFGTVVKAEETVSQINYAYANYLGTGVYTAGDQAVQVYRMPFYYTLRETEVGKTGIEFRLPVTVGFANFETTDIVDGKIPNNAATITFVPGVDLSYRIVDNWTVSTFLDLGFGYDFRYENTAYVFGAGIRSLATFEFSKHRLELFNGFLYAGNTTQPDDDIIDFNQLETGINLQFPLKKRVWNRKTAVSTYYINYLYFNDLNFLLHQQEAVGVSVQHEVGVTFDTFPDMEILRIPFSRVGLGVRLGDEGEAIRLVFGVPFY